MSTTPLYRFVKASDLEELKKIIEWCIDKLEVCSPSDQSDFFNYTHNGVNLIDEILNSPYPSTDDALQAEAEALYKGNVRMRQAHIRAIQLERARAKGTQERVREAMFDSWVAALERVDYLNNGNSRDCPPPPDKFEFINPYLERLFSLSQQSVSTETAEVKGITKTANEFLWEYGIDTMSMNDDFNSQLFHAMERYAEAYASSRSLKDEKEVAADAWESALDWQHEEFSGPIPNKYPNKETYLNSLNK